MSNRGIQLHRFRLAVTIVTVLAGMMSMRETAASCGDYLHRRSGNLSTDLLPADLLPADRRPADSRVTAEHFPTELRWDRASFERAASGTDRRTLREGLSRTECRGPHCQKAPAGTAAPLELITVPRETRDLLAEARLKSGDGDPCEPWLAQSSIHRSSPGYPRLPEIPPELNAGN